MLLWNGLITFNQVLKRLTLARPRDICHHGMWKITENMSILFQIDMVCFVFVKCFSRTLNLWFVLRSICSQTILYQFHRVSLLLTLMSGLFIGHCCSFAVPTTILLEARDIVISQCGFRQSNAYKPIWLEFPHGWDHSVATWSKTKCCLGYHHSNVFLV